MPALGNRRMSCKRKFIADGVFYSELNELLISELAEDGYAGVEVRTTPHRTEIIIRATRTQNVLGENGRRIRELTSVVQKRFGFAEGAVELYAERVQNRGLYCKTNRLECFRLFRKRMKNTMSFAYVLGTFWDPSCLNLWCFFGVAFLTPFGMSFL